MARKKIAESRSLPTMTSIETRSSSVGDVKSPVIGSTAVVVKKPNHGLVKGFGKSVAKIIDTGIAGMEQITDLGLLLGNIGTHKIRAKLDGQNGNHEIFNLLVKYVSMYIIEFNLHIQTINEIFHVCQTLNILELTKYLAYCSPHERSK